MKRYARFTMPVFTIFCYLFAIVLASPNADAANEHWAGSPPTSFIIGIAPGATGESVEIIIDGITALALEAKKGTPITVYDAISSRKITSFTTPTGRSSRLNQRVVKKATSSISSYLDRSQAVRTTDGNQVNLPRFLESISSSVRIGGGGTRVIIFGSLFFSDEREPDSSFIEGLVPSDEFLRRTSFETLYGTADKEGALAGVAVDICTLGHEAGSLDQRAVERFWSLFLSSQGAVLTTVEGYPDVLVQRAVSGAMDPVTRSELDPKDTVLEIRPVRKPVLQTTPAPVPTQVPAPKPVPQPVRVETHGSSITPFTPQPLTPTPISVDGMMLIDGTLSMYDNLLVLDGIATSTAGLGARMTGGYSFGAFIYRMKNSSSIFPLSSFERSTNEQSSTGMEAWKAFTQDSTMSLIDREGKQRVIRNIEGINSLADIEHGIRESLRMLEAGRGQRKVLIIAGDRGSVEMDNELNGFSEQDRLACQRVEQMVREFMQSNSDFRVVALFTGDSDGREVERESAAFFKRVAAISGDHGVYTEDIAELESIVAQAILTD